MRTVRKLIKELDIQNIVNQNDDIQIEGIAFDSRKVEKGYLFVATKGTHVDGHSYIDKAIELGAIAILCEELPANTRADISYVVVGNSQYALGLLASSYYDDPSSKMTVVGITGTNGKTSTATMLFQLMTHLGYKCGLLSTIQIQIGSETIHATHTTPDALAIQSNMARMVDAGCSYCFMEVSSHAIDQWRIAGIDFHIGVFTNITHDHLDYHKTFANYIDVKKKFFDDLSPNAVAIVNIDDKHGRVMIQNTQAKKKTLALHSMADYTLKIMDMTMSYMTVRLQNQDEVTLNVVGEFNAYNALSSYAVAIALGMKKEEVLLALTKIEPVEGRIDVITSPHRNIRGVIDYAHTPDAVEKVLVEISKIRKEGNIITVIGCGGDRDREKRPLMASLAAQYSHRVILTSDNPRSEDPKEIIDEMKTGLSSDGLKKSLTIIHRSEAIKSACMLADEGDIIVLVGKGHEKYQEINGVKSPFDDKEELKKYFEELGL